MKKLFLMATLVLTTCVIPNSKAMGAGLADLFSGFSLTSSTEGSYYSCAGAFVDQQTKASYGAVGGCTPHWKQLEMNGKPIAQLIGFGMFGAASITPDTPNSQKSQGAVTLNLINMMGLDAAVGETFDGHFITMGHLSDQTFFDKLTKP